VKLRRRPVVSTDTPKLRAKSIHDEAPRCVELLYSAIVLGTYEHAFAEGHDRRIVIADLGLAAVAQEDIFPREPWQPLALDLRVLDGPSNVDLEAKRVRAAGMPPPRAWRPHHAVSYDFFCIFDFVVHGLIPYWF
jgi:hypothetical protein